MQDISMTQPAAAASPSLLPVRLLLALIQASALYFLLHTDASPAGHTWQNAAPQLFIPLLLVAAYTPLALMLGCGQLRPVPLVIWGVVVALVAAGLGYFDALRGIGFDYRTSFTLPWPWSRLWLAVSAAGFVGQVLVTNRFSGHRHVPQDGPAYARHFNTAWKLGLQIALAACFVSGFWLVLDLSAELFRAIGIGTLRYAIGQDWFGIPMTTLALAVSLHVTDIQSRLIRSARMLVLTLFSWLLPLLAALLAAFLVSLVFLSVKPLWETNFAALLLLAASALLIFLINSYYQDGTSAHAGQRVRRLAATLGAIELVPLVALALWALSLRVRQYGWTVDRIMAAAVAIMMTCYAVGYAWAALRSPAWMKRLETTNIAGAYLFLVLTLLVFSPIANPSRLMVQSQVGRLQSGAADPKTFDYAALSSDGKHWGVDALRELAESAQGPSADTIKAQARRTLETYADDPNRTPTLNRTFKASDLADATDVYPAGRQLPAQFLLGDFWSPRHLPLPSCVYDDSTRCTARYLTLRPGEPEVLLLADTQQRELFRQDAPGEWQYIANVVGGGTCAGVDAGLAKGDIKTDAPQWPDLIVGGTRLTLTPPDTPC